MLDDPTTPFLWSNDELTTYADKLQKELASEIPLLTDRTTAAICKIDLSQADGLLSIDPRILMIKTAKIDGETNFLQIQDSDYMDAYYPEWYTDTTEGTPTHLVTRGVETNKAFLYPLADEDIDGGVLSLSVVRDPLITLDFTTNEDDDMELERYAHLFVHGILKEAYMKQDTDAFDPRRAERHRIKWEGEEGNGGDKEKIRLLYYRYHGRSQSASPMAAWM
jgi:hypothetical protein